MSAINLGRRMFFRQAAALAAVPALLPGNTHAVEALTNPSMSIGSSVLGALSGNTYPVPSSILGGAARQILEHRMTATVDRFRIALGYRDGQFDADIAACRSWSFAFKTQKQRARDFAKMQEIADMRWQLWGS